MTRRTALLFAAAAAIGVGAAAALIATRDDARRAPRQASPAKATPIDNRFRLSHAQSVPLVDWAARFRSCMARRGVVLGEPVAHPKEIDLAIVRAPARPALARSVFTAATRTASHRAAPRSSFGRASSCSICPAGASWTRGS